VADGVYRLAIDGVVVRNYTNVIYMDTGTTPNLRIEGVGWNPTWGTNPVPYDLHVYSDGHTFKSAP
jgi:hypothetical protein